MKPDASQETTRAFQSYRVRRTSCTRWLVIDLQPPVHLKLYSERVLNLTLVDLPGLTKVCPISPLLSHNNPHRQK